MKLSLRMQLTIWYVIAFLALFGVLFLTLNHFLAVRLASDLDDDLFTYALSIEDQGRKAHAQTIADYQSAVLAVGVQNNPAVPRKPLFTRLLDPKGEVVASFPNSFRTVSALVQNDLPTDDAYRDVKLPGPGATRLYDKALINNEGAVIGYLEIADTQKQQLDKPLAKLRSTLAWEAAAGSLVAVIIGYFITRRALRSLDSVVKVADQVHERNLLERVPDEPRPSEVQRLADALNDLLQRVEKAFEQQRRFSADVSHELRTPLAALRTQLEVMQMDPDLPANVRLKLVRLEAETARLIHLTSNLLTLSQLEADRLIERNPVDLVPLIHEVYREAHMLSNNRRMAITREDEATVMGDASLLKQVCLNLVTNAIKYTGEDGRIDIAVVAQDGHATLTVADNGSGIPKEAMAHVFEPFFRADQSRSRATGGAGLGLAITKQIVERHGGTVTLESVEGKGTTVAVTLPLAKNGSA